MVGFEENHLTQYSQHQTRFLVQRKMNVSCSRVLPLIGLYPRCPFRSESPEISTKNFLQSVELLLKNLKQISFLFCLISTRESDLLKPYNLEFKLKVKNFQLLVKVYYNMTSQSMTTFRKKSNKSSKQLKK